MSTQTPTLLQINTSLFAESGNSSALSERFVSEWRKSHPNGQVIVRDLSRSPIPHLDGARASALFTPGDQRTPEQNAVVAESDALIAELKSADVVVLGLPMYNFGVPSVFKSYIDHVARAGVTFRYTANGPEGLVGDRKLYVMAARGGIYKDLPIDTQTGFVKTFFNFIGIRDIEFVYAEGLNIDAASKTRALEAAGAEIDRLAA